MARVGVPDTRKVVAPQCVINAQGMSATGVGGLFVIGVDHQQL